MSKVTDLTGQRFGRLLVLEPLFGGKRTRWKCLCDCGQVTIVGSGAHLTSGNTRSCGCLHRECSKNRHYKHGGKGTRLYNIWKNMRQRCYNPNRPDYYLYGGRGIKIDDSWADFGVFKEWALANGYQTDLTIDRKDVNGDYGPDNCRWATWEEQRHNQRRCKEVRP